MKMGEWQQYLQSVFIGLIFSFLLAKLFSVIFAFRDENLRISRVESTEAEEPTPSESVVKGSSIAGEKTGVLEETQPSSSQEEKAVSVRSEVSDSDDDWEGVESTELDEAFSAATAFVAATAADRSSLKVSNEVQLQLYGLYKIATEGPCSAPQPSALKMTARAKWQAWHRLGTMPPEEAMQKYLDIVTELYPSWLGSSDTKRKGEESSSAGGDAKGPMGPVFSSFVYEEESGSDLTMDAIHGFAREGDKKNLMKCIESGVPVNVKDSEGRTPLHWAVDRGHLDVTELLLSSNADVNAKDNEGQTALHYAAMCERADIAEFLVRHSADIMIKDNDGNSPGDLCELSWPWLQATTT